MKKNCLTKTIWISDEIIKKPLHEQFNCTSFMTKYLIKEVQNNYFYFELDEQWKIEWLPENYIKYKQKTVTQYMENIAKESENLIVQKFVII